MLRQYHFLRVIGARLNTYRLFANETIDTKGFLIRISQAITYILLFCKIRNDGFLEL